MQAITPAGKPRDCPSLSRCAMRSAITGRSSSCMVRYCAIALAQQRLSPIVLRPVGQDVGAPAQHHPAELLPVLVVAVGDEGDRGILHHVAQPLQRRAEARFGFSSIVM